MYGRRRTPKPAYKTAYRCHLRVTIGSPDGDEAMRDSAPELMNYHIELPSIGALFDFDKYHVCPIDVGPLSVVLVSSK